MMQNVQMRATLNELQLSRLEMSESTEALKAQVKNSNAQKFDNIFFSLIDNYKLPLRELREKDFYDGNQHKIKGAYENFVLEEINSIPAVDRLKLDKYWSNVKDAFLSIFLLNYQILKYIEDNIHESITPRDAKRYIVILRAITPRDIVFLIFINCGLINFENYKRLLERFSFFEHLYFTGFNIKIFKIISIEYDIKVFGDRERLSIYVDSTPASLLFLAQPMKDFTFYKRRFDQRKMNLQQKHYFKLVVDNETLNIKSFHDAFVKDKRSETIKKIVSENKFFKLFCNNDINLDEEFYKKISNLIEQSKNNIEINFRQFLK